MISACPMTGTPTNGPATALAKIISFRTPEGVARQKDLPFTTEEGGNTGHTRWHSNALVHERQRRDPDRWPRSHHPWRG